MAEHDKQRRMPDGRSRQAVLCGTPIAVRRRAPLAVWGLAILTLIVVLALSVGPVLAAVADWDEPTKRLFTAIEAGNLVAVQKAVLDGADLGATDDTGKTGAKVAEELGHYAITHFLLSYEALEEPPDKNGRPAATTGTKAPATVEIPSAPIAPAAKAMQTTPVIRPRVTVEEVVSPPSKPTPDSIESSYFARLTALNPSPAPSSAGQIAGQTAMVDQPMAGSGAAQTGEQAGPNETVEEEPTGGNRGATGETSESPKYAAIPKDIETRDGKGTVVTLIPAPVPGSETTEENRRIKLPPPPEGGFAKSEDHPESLLGGANAEPTQMAQIESGAGSTEGAAASGSEVNGKTGKQDDGSFIGKLRRFSGDRPGASHTTAALKPEDMTSPPGEKTVAAPYPVPEGQMAEGLATAGQSALAAVESRLTAVKGGSESGLTGLEKMHDEAVARLKAESDARQAQLEESRQVATARLKKTQENRDFQAGIANVKTEARAQKRYELTGSPYPPGFVPPPDGGSSAIRFLQRLGLIGEDKPTGLAEAVGPRVSNLPKQGKMGPVTPANPEDARTPREITELSFINSGYAAPPLGQNLNTEDNHAVGALQQIARLLSTPDQGYPRGAKAATDSNGFPTGQYSGQSQARTQLPSPRQNPTQSRIAAASPIQTKPTPPPSAAPLLPPPTAVTQGSGSASDLTSGWSTTIVQPGGEATAQSAPTSGGEASGGLVDSLSNLFDSKGLNATVSAEAESGSASATATTTRNQPAITEPSGSWDVIAVEPGAPPPPRTLLGGPVQQYAPSGNARSNLALAIGKDMLGKAPPPPPAPETLRKTCIDKRRDTVSFCIEAADWPEAIRQYMRVDTVMYQGLSLISRYDNGVATRFYALFPSEQFEHIVRYFADTLGKPSSIWKRSIAPLAQPRAKNPTVRWKSVNPETQAVSILEIRQYDDTRGGYPDERRGAIMLYRAKAGPIFPQVSALELMRLRPAS